MLDQRSNELSDSRVFWRVVWVGLLTLTATAVLVLVMYTLQIGFFSLDTHVNNKVIQPQMRSRLDSDANYRRGVEAQARGDVSLYTVSVQKSGADYALLKSFETHTYPPYTFQQQQEYDNLLATLQGDYGAINRTAADYNALAQNPDNAGLRTFDPSLPPSLQIPAQEPLP